MNKSAVI